MFGVAAVIAKLLLWRVANPPAFFAGLGAFVTATALGTMARASAR